MASNEDWYQAAKEFNINEIPYENFSRGLTEDNEVGNGAFGTVYKTTCEPIGLVAIKRIPGSDVKKIINELKIHHRMDHERIIQFYGIGRNVNKNRCYLVLEFADRGDLRNFLSDNKEHLEWEKKRRLAIQIVEGLRYLHETWNVAHRDLRTQNILVKNEDIKIADFGLSKNLGSRTSSKDSQYGELPFIDMQKLINPTYRLDKRSDIYSLGVVLWEISSCCPPFSKIEDVAIKKDNIHNGHKENPVEGTPTNYVEIYTDCWKLNPDSRPSIGQVFSRLQSMSLEPQISNIRSDNYVKDEIFEIWIQKAIIGDFFTYIPFDELSQISQIGKGGFGVVSKARWSKTNDYIALKGLLSRTSARNTTTIQLQHEIQMQNKGHTCDNVIRFLGISRGPQNDYLIAMEYADEGDLRSYLSNKFETLVWKDKFRLASDIISGIFYLHMNDIIHRDLHSKNIVIRKRIAKITDFGLAESVETQVKNEKIGGVIAYVAPELFNFYAGYSKKTDIYSLGVLLWELSSGRPPFSDNNDDFENLPFMIKNGLRESEILGTPHDYYDLYTVCWDGNPAMRPTIEDAYDKLMNMMNMANPNDTKNTNNMIENTIGSSFNDNLYLTSSSDSSI